MRAADQRSGGRCGCSSSTPRDTSAETIERYLRAWGMVPTRVADCADGASSASAAAPAGERFDVAIVAASASEDEAQQLARELHAQAGEDGVFVIALLDIGERIARGGDGAPPSGFDAVVGRPIKQSRLYDALVGHPGRARAGRQPRPPPRSRASWPGCGS